MFLLAPLLKCNCVDITLSIIDWYDQLESDIMLYFLSNYKVLTTLQFAQFVLKYSYRAVSNFNRAVT